MAAVKRKKRVIKAKKKVTKSAVAVSTIPVATAEKNCTTCGCYTESFGKKGGCFFHPKQRAGAARGRCKNWEAQ